LGRSPRDEDFEIYVEENFLKTDLDLLVTRTSRSTLRTSRSALRKISSKRISISS